MTADDRRINKCLITAACEASTITWFYRAAVGTDIKTVHERWTENEADGEALQACIPFNGQQRAPRL